MVVTLQDVSTLAETVGKSLQDMDTTIEQDTEEETEQKATEELDSAETEASEEAEQMLDAEKAEESNVEQSTEESQVYIEDLTIASSGRYTGNLGDSFVGKIGRSGNGYKGADGVTYQHGLEMWIARWNFEAESSWAWAKYEVPTGMKYLSGTLTYLVGSYNKSNFDSTFEIYGDDTLILQKKITQKDTSSINITVSLEGY